MMRAWTVVGVMAIGITAHAQPSTEPGVAPPASPYGPPMAPPPPYSPSSVQPMPRPQVTLTTEDRELLARGEIDDDTRVAGGMLATFVGLGVGQVVEGRWFDTGWIFTLGETATGAAFTIGLVESFSCGDVGMMNMTCNNHGGALLLVGMLGFLGFRVAGAVDGFVGPTHHNARVRALKLRLGYPVTPYIGRATGDDGTVAGLGFRF